MPRQPSIAEQFVRFAIVGAGGTTGHYAILLILVELEIAAPMPASAIGFAIGAVVNYFLNHKYTFRSSVPHWNGLPKFLTIAAVGLALNTAVMALTRLNPPIHYVIVQIIATCVVLLWAFTANRAWTFNEIRR